MQLAELNVSDLTICPPETTFDSTMYFSKVFNGDFENSFKILGKVSSGARSFENGKISFFMEVPMSDIKKMWAIQIKATESAGLDFLGNRELRNISRNSNHLSIKLPHEEGQWKFECDDKKFTPTNLKALIKGSTISVIGAFGVYYSDDGYYGLFFKVSGLYLNDKENHPKAPSKKTGTQQVTVTTTSFGKNGSLTRKVPVNSQTLKPSPYQRQFTSRPSKLSQMTNFPNSQKHIEEEDGNEEDIIEEENVEVVG